MLTAQEEMQLQRVMLRPNPWGKSYYVNSAHSAASAGKHSGLVPTSPLSTIVEAYAKAAAGDVIHVGPGHVEALITATQLAISLDNIALIGHGRGTTQPKITIGGVVGATLGVSGEGCSMDNFQLEPAIGAVTLGLSVSGGQFQMANCRVLEGTAMQFATAVYLNAPGCLIERLTAYQPTAGAVACINAGAGAVYSRIQDCYIHGDYSTANINNATGTIPTWAIKDNMLENLNAVDQVINNGALTNGMIVKNACRIATDVEVTWIDPGDCALFENYGVNDDAETGKLIGTPSV